MNETEFIDREGKHGRGTPRQVALTRRCVSRRLKRRLHRGQRDLDGGIRTGGNRVDEETRNSPKVVPGDSSGYMQSSEQTRK